MRAVAELVPYAKNARTHSKEQVAQLAASIERFGWTSPVLVDDEGIIAGHGRVLAAKLLGQVEVPTLNVNHLDAAERRALILADNRLAELAGWDAKLLALELGELRSLNVPLLSLGFTPADVDRLIAEANGRGLRNVDEDDPDIEPPPAPRTKRGDVWLCGAHRVACGDSTTAADVALATKGEACAMLWTDPPYGVSLVGGSRGYSPEERLARGGKTIENDALDEAALEVFLRSSLSGAVSSLREGGAVFVAAPPGPLFHVFGTVLRELDVWRQTLTWVKDSLVMGRSDYHYRHEPLFFGWRPGAGHHRPADRKGDSVWEVARPKRSEEHPTMKPIELIERAVENHTDAGERVLDVFGGSGSTLIACERTGRVARLVELAPGYVDVIVRRWQAFTRKQATREADGAPFDDVAPVRAA